MPRTGKRRARKKSHSSIPVVERGKVVLKLILFTVSKFKELKEGKPVVVMRLRFSSNKL
jgi:hypothetical protein